MAPKFIFLRHGEAEHNVAFHDVGESAFKDEKYRDAPLTQKGVEQVQAAAEALQPYKLLDLWCSPLLRCRQTAGELFEELNINKLYLHDNLLERQGGGHVCNERVPKETIKKDDFLFEASFLPDTPAVWNERESNTVLLQRTKMLILQLADMYKTIDESYHILIVGHGDALGCLLNRPFKNAEFVVLGLEELPRMLDIVK